jgi:hypothetical protein
MTRDQGIDMVIRYDHVRPSDLDLFTAKSGISEAELLAMIEPMRDPAIWQRNGTGSWHVKDHVGNHRNGPGVEAARLPNVGNWRPFDPTVSRASERFQEDGRQSDYVLL